MRLTLAFALSLLAASAAHATVPVAVSYFDNDTGKAELAPLSKGLADMLITDLGNLSAITIVEREKLNTVLDELKLSKSKFIDPKTAQKLGKGLAAQFILTGSYHLAGEALRIDARIVKVDTGHVAGTQKVEGKKDEFFAMEKELVDLLVKTLDLKLGFSEKGKLRSNQTESFAAWSSYSAGLDAQDRGDPKEAQAAFLAALEADPNYRAAKSASERLAALYQHVDAAQATSWAEQFKQLDPKAKDFAARVERMLAETDATREEGMKRKLVLLTWLAERDLTPQTSPNYNLVASHAMALVGRFTECPAEWESVIQTCDYFAQRMPKDPTVLGRCRSELESIDSDRKEAGRAESSQKEWDEDGVKDLKLDHDDWRYALVTHRGDIVKLMRLYAAKAKR
jgi:TolB-like protein